VLVCLAFTFAAGCVMGAPMTPQVIQESGTHSFNAPYAKVFAATEGALKSEGYPIAISQPDKGLIKTGQKIIKAVARGYGSSSSYRAEAVGIARQYVVHVSRSGATTVVSAEPRIFQGNADLSDKPVWDLDSPQGERALWEGLFRDIQEVL
jgi:hypothetical protein